jgi:hypothetical protein
MVDEVEDTPPMQVRGRFASGDRERYNLKRSAAVDSL